MSFNILPDIEVGIFGALFYYTGLFAVRIFKGMKYKPSAASCAKTWIMVLGAFIFISVFFTFVYLFYNMPK